MQKMKKLLKWIAVACVSVAAVPAFAAPNCSVEVESNDAMQFNAKAISVPAACKDFTVKLKHVGKMPKSAMGHNLVIAKTADMQGIANDGIPAGADKDYVKPADARVIDEVSRNAVFSATRPRSNKSLPLGPAA